jgi:hypothetical protein
MGRKTHAFLLLALVILASVAISSAQERKSPAHASPLKEANLRAQPVGSASNFCATHSCSPCMSYIVTTAHRMHVTCATTNCRCMHSDDLQAAALAVAAAATTCAQLAAAAVVAPVFHPGADVSGQHQGLAQDSLVDCMLATDLLPLYALKLTSRFPQVSQSWQVNIW